MPHHVLVVGSLKPVPAEVTGSDLVDRISVITEPDCVKYYGAGIDVFTVPSIDDFTAVRDVTLGLLADRRIDAVLAPTEFGIGVCGLLRSYFGLPGMGYETANAFANKYVMKQKLAEAGVPVTPFRLVPRLDNLPGAADKLGWPVVVKRTFGGGTVDVTVVESAKAFDRFVASEQSAGLREAGCPLIAERFVDIDVEYHCDGVVADGETTFAAVSEYLTPVLGGIGGFQGSFHLPATDPDAARVHQLHQEVVRALGMRSGVTHLEVFKTSGGFLVGEITCRPGGGGIVEAVALQCGVDIWRAYLETSLGLRPTVAPVLRDDIVVHLMLPARPGRITELSAAEDLSALPGVLRVDMLHKPGDVIEDVMYSTNVTGLVFLAAKSVAEVAQLVRQVSEAYVLRVEAMDPIR